MEHQHTNLLVHETSPYLLQHSHNPVDWHPWGEEAFQKATRENKPVLLSIGYSACHWCHVMERESFENEQIAALMNELFVNIKVDREERPDLDEIYMNAVQMMTGRGGWPMTMFLTPDGKPFYGGTYFPPEDRYNVPGFPKILRGVANAYHKQPQDVENSVKQILERLQSMSRSIQSAKPFEPDTVTGAAEQLLQAHDSEHGGFGQAPKFPNAGVYELFLRAYHQSKNTSYLDAITFTLMKMARGGIYDHLGGGFHRYSVDEKWLVPHFEKMLYDNAQLVRIYAQIYCLTAELQFKRVVEETVDYLLREMLQPEGGFYSTQDADSEGEEGKFFVWTPAEVSRVLGAETAEILCRIYDVSEQGNFEDKNILHPILTPEQASKYFNRSVEEITSLVAQAKQKLFSEREKRIKPFRDEKLITAWNGLALSGLAAAIRITGKAEYRDAATRTIEFIFSRMVRDGRLLHTYKDGIAKILGYLDDYAFLGVGLLDLFEATFDGSLLARARELADIMLDEFWDENDGAFFYTGKSHERLISRAKPAFDASIPSGNSMAAQLLLRLYHYTSEDDYLKKAETILRSYRDAMAAQPFGLAHMLAALDFYLQKPQEIVVVGEPNDPATKALLTGVHSTYLPNSTLQLVGPREPLEKIAPLLQGKNQIGGKATAYVCHNFTCAEPVTTWDDLETLLNS
ncbi:MAG TPA: thioredoxin domain-containing protein [Candidatus Binatia bacterium]|jgi:uncharacterized protein YyaL (SSP411 family)